LLYVWAMKSHDQILLKLKKKYFRILLNFIVLAFLLLGFEAFAQGRLLIVGGGSEKNGASSWSTPAYRWAGEGKKVAIVGTSTGSLAPYFTQQCGAIYAREFAIATQDSADSQATFDTLAAYDVIFFRGGDQWEYYDLYRNTKLQEAVNFVFAKGGVIAGTSAGMHILSSIVFTAENGTVYPYECIENPNNQYVTLANDFMNLVPGFVFDTHFAERGRFGRLVGFLANYSLNQNIAITGLGMDDMTCMTIDENGLGTVYGTGCANIYKAGSTYSLNGTKLLADTINIVQLLQGCTYNFVTGQAGFETLDRQINTSQQEETGNYTILASGGSTLSNNQSMLNDLVNLSGTQTAGILLLTGDTNLAASFKNKLLELGSSEVSVFQANQQSGNDPDLATTINQVTKILFLKNDYPVFQQFIATPNGALLSQKLKNNGMISAFAGADARLAGKTVIENYLTPNAAYYAELTFGNGLSLLQHTVIMADTYLDNDIYENTAVSVPYVMAKDTLKYGIWLTNHNYMKFTPIEGATTLTGFGTAPVMIISNRGTLAGFSTQTSTGSTSFLPRMNAGFEHLQLSLIDYTTPYIMGNAQPSGVRDFVSNSQPFISPNPVRKQLHFTWKYGNCHWEIITADGQNILFGFANGETGQIDVSKLKPGFYILKLTEKGEGISSVSKFIIE